MKDRYGGQEEMVLKHVSAAVGKNHMILSVILKGLSDQRVLSSVSVYRHLQHMIAQQKSEEMVIGLLTFSNFLTWLKANDPDAAKHITDALAADRNRWHTDQNLKFQSQLLEAVSDGI